MLDELEDLATQLGMFFAYGLETELNDFAQKNSLQSKYLLFHNGYFQTNLNEDGQGAIEFRHQLTLFVMVKSKPTDKPANKRQQLAALKEQMLKVYKALKSYGQILPGAKAVSGLNLTTTNLDAIQLTLTLLPVDAISLCNY